MDGAQSFEQFLALHSAPTSLPLLALNLVVAIVLAAVLGMIYARFGTAIGNRKRFARNLVPVAATTMLVIAIVKTSLALSLGLVGALSIVRFRAAIKEPEELTYLFLAIAVGLGCGANQLEVTTLCFVITVGALVVIGRRRPTAPPGMLLAVRARGEGRPSLQAVIDIVTEACRAASLRRVDDSPELLDALFSIEVDTPEVLQSTTDRLRALHAPVEVTFIDAADES